MIDIIIASHAPLKMHIIVNGCKNIILGNVFRDQIMDVLADRFLEILKIVILIHKLF